MWSGAPSGKSAAISRVTFRVALGSLLRTAMISSAICTRRFFAVLAVISTEPLKLLGFDAAGGGDAGVVGVRGGVAGVLVSDGPS